ARRRERQLRSCWWRNEATKLHEKIRSWNYSSRVSGRMMSLGRLLYTYAPSMCMRREQQKSSSSHSAVVLRRSMCTHSTAYTNSVQRGDRPSCLFRWICNALPCGGTNCFSPFKLRGSTHYIRVYMYKHREAGTVAEATERDQRLQVQQQQQQHRLRIKHTYRQRAQNSFVCMCSSELIPAAAAAEAVALLLLLPTCLYDSSKNTHTGRRSIHRVLDDDDLRCLALDVDDDDTQWSTRLRHLTNPHSRARGKDAARASQYVRECSRCVCRARLLRAESRSREWRAITTTIRLRRRSHSRRRATLHKTRAFIGVGHHRCFCSCASHFDFALSKCYTHRIYFKKHKQRLRIQHTQRDNRFTEIQLRIKPDNGGRRRQCRRLGTADSICAVRVGYILCTHTNTAATTALKKMISRIRARPRQRRSTAQTSWKILVIGRSMDAVVGALRTDLIRYRLCTMTLCHCACTRYEYPNNFQVNEPCNIARHAMANRKLAYFTKTKRKLAYFTKAKRKVACFKKINCRSRSSESARATRQLCAHFRFYAYAAPYVAELRRARDTYSETLLYTRGAYPAQQRRHGGGSQHHPPLEQKGEAARAKASILTRPSGPQYSSCVYTRAVSWLNFVYTLYTITRRPVIGSHFYLSFVACCSLCRDTRYDIISYVKFNVLSESGVRIVEKFKVFRFFCKEFPSFYLQKFFKKKYAAVLLWLSDSPGDDEERGCSTLRGRGALTASTAADTLLGSLLGSSFTLNTRVLKYTADANQKGIRKSLFYIATRRWIIGEIQLVFRRFESASVSCICTSKARIQTPECVSRRVSRKQGDFTRRNLRTRTQLSGSGRLFREIFHETPVAQGFDKLCVCEHSDVKKITQVYTRESECTRRGALCTTNLCINIIKVNSVQYATNILVVCKTMTVLKDHSLSEIRLRALENIISKLELGFECDCNAIKKELLAKLFNYKLSANDTEMITKITLSFLAHNDDDVQEVTYTECHSLVTSTLVGDYRNSARNSDDAMIDESQVQFITTPNLVTSLCTMLNSLITIGEAEVIPDFLDLLLTLMNKGDLMDVEIAGSSLWALVSNNQRGKVIARSAGFPACLNAAISRLSLQQNENSEKERELKKMLEYILQVIRPRVEGLLQHDDRCAVPRDSANGIASMLTSVAATAAAAAAAAAWRAPNCGSLMPARLLLHSYMCTAVCYSSLIRASAECPPSAYE
ncbi:unnamed protein product, partial [Trichogramma brassicae]